MSPGPDGLRERKKRATRFALSQAAIHLCLERGYDNVTVEDIATAANVSDRTFRNYFTSKAEAIVATHVERGHRTAEALQARPADEPLWEALVKAVVTQFEAPNVPANPIPPDSYTTALQKLLAEPAVQHEVFRAHALAQDDLAKAIAERVGADADTLHSQLVAAVVSAALGTAMSHWARNPTRGLVPLLHDVFAQVRSGLPTPR